MRVKLYRAQGMAAAMALIRDELGPEALILATRRLADGVEVTAALEPTEEPGAWPAGEATEPWGEPSRAGTAQPATPAPADDRRTALLARHGVPAALAARLGHGTLEAALEAALAFAPLPLAPGGKPLLLAGPPGAGKTLTAAKLATRLVMGGIAPAVISADGRRAGAVEQLAAYTRLLGIELLVAGQPAALARALARPSGGPALIDAPGLDPFDPGQRAELAALIAAAGASVALVLPAGLDPVEAAEIADAHAALGAQLLVPTRLDLARRLGSVLTAAAAGLALAEAGIGPGAADGLAPCTPALLAARLRAMAPAPAAARLASPAPEAAEAAPPERRPPIFIPPPGASLRPWRPPSSPLRPRSGPPR